MMGIIHGIGADDDDDADTSFRQPRQHIRPLPATYFCAMILRADFYTCLISGIFRLSEATLLAITT